jgi:hypothetical protein
MEDDHEWRRKCFKGDTGIYGGTMVITEITVFLGVKPYAFEVTFYQTTFRHLSGIVFSS